MKKSYFIEIISSVLVIAIAIFFSLAASFNDTEYTVTVTDKERVVKISSDESNSSSKYLVFTEDAQGETIVFENTDNIFRGKFNSSTFQGQLKIGNTYRITVVGYRVPFLSMYQNIIAIEGVENG